mgnify:FL=1|jgi:hypothetical protein
MKYFYIKNLRSTDITIVGDVASIKSKVPYHKTKSDHRKWSAEASTDHVFYNTVEADSPRERVGVDNPPRLIYGVVGDYDAAVDWTLIEDLLEKAPHTPTWISKTHSDYMRLVWEFESPVPTSDDMFPAFMKQMAKILTLQKLHAGFDSTSTKSSQYFDLGTHWKQIGVSLPKSVTQTAAIKAASTQAPRSGDVVIPIEVVAKEVDTRFPNRWSNPFEVGQRGPLFWINDGIERDGCQIVEDGIVCYSDRAGKGFVTWAEIFGRKFVQDYEEEKVGSLLNDYWYNGRNFYKMSYGQAVNINESQITRELKKAGFSHKTIKGKNTSEIDEAILAICNVNRVNDIAPVIFSTDRIVEFNSNRILNTACLHPTAHDSDGDISKWPFIHEWLHQLFANCQGQRPTVEYFFAWLQRFYIAVTNHQLTQGQAMLLVGPTNKGKSLLSNKVIAALVGGFSDASEYLSGTSQFNKDLARVAAWVVDDTTSAASFQDQLKATELIKRAVANPRMEYMAKYSDAMSVPWTGRVIMSLNEDANSLSVIPALDSSNRDKIMALRISENATSNFPPNHVLEETIERELPHFAKWLLDHQPHEEIMDGPARFGVVSFIDEKIAEAAYDNSSRSSVAELVDWFAKQARNYTAEGETEWRGTLTEFLIATMSFNDGRTVGRSNNPEFVRRGMCTMEETTKTNNNVRPVRSEGHGGGKVWVVNIEEKFDIEKIGQKPTSSLAQI